MHRLLVVSCSQRKHSNLEPLPAIERYDGPAIRLLRRFRRLRPLEQVSIYFLSARFGLLHETQLIASYDQRMTPSRARELQPAVLSEMERILGFHYYRELCICLGQNYLDALNGYEALVSPKATVKIIRGAPGRQLSELHDWLYRSPPSRFSEVKTAIARSKASIRGVEVALTPEQIFDIARRALKAGRGYPDRYQSWCVLVDELPVSPKWLISQITGLPVSAFVTDEARRALLQLGVQVIRV